MKGQVPPVYRVTIPPLFGRDHLERDLPTGQIVKENVRGLTLWCDLSTLREWLSDARHFSDCAGPGWDFGHGAGCAHSRALQRSARLTVDRVRAVLDAIAETAERDALVAGLVEALQAVLPALDSLATEEARANKAPTGLPPRHTALNNAANARAAIAKAP